MLVPLLTQVIVKQIDNRLKPNQVENLFWTEGKDLSQGLEAEDYVFNLAMLPVPSDRESQQHSQQSYLCVIDPVHVMRIVELVLICFI